MFGYLSRWHLLDVTTTLYLLYLITLADVEYIPQAQRRSPEVICGVEKKYGKAYGKEDQSTPFRVCLVVVTGRNS